MEVVCKYEHLLKKGVGLTLLICLALFNYVQSEEFQIDESRYRLSESQSLIPPFSNSHNWLFRGSTITPNKTIQLTELKTCSRKSVWNTIPNLATSWKLTFEYTAFSPNKDQRVADGLALWYLPPSVQSTYESAQFMYGGPSGNFTGLLIAIDTYSQKSSKNLKRNFDQSAVIVVYNDVPREYNWETEGFEIESGRGLVTNRYLNTNESISKMAIEYVDNILKIYHNERDNDLHLVLTVKDLKLPLGYNFGISAASGGLFGLFELRNFKFHPDSLTMSQQLPQVYESTKPVQVHMITKTVTEPTSSSTIMYSMFGLCGMIILILSQNNSKRAQETINATAPEQNESGCAIEMKEVQGAPPILPPKPKKKRFYFKLSTYTGHGRNLHRSHDPNDDYDHLNFN
uniref:CSON008024 protein n=1 Tax=Culicoides sonorensis TaxID=179676 RepID=A0A336N152_CULSO